jgi:hypothetical protein
MADDTRNFLERSDSMNEKLHGKPTTVKDNIDAFMLRDVNTRALELDYVENELKSGEPLTVAEAVERRHLRRRFDALSDMHHRLRKADR